ncbi:MAG: DUF3868 domain-containing protein [Tannerellaceae bacterium]|nr:DUF3868 domain-containing protein [Tannerellaceae bacterium]
MTLLLAATPFTFAQQAHRGQISLPGELVQQGNQLYLNLDADLTSLDLDRNRALVLTPVLVGAGKRIEYPSILVNGKVRNKAYHRALALDDDTRYAQSRYYAVLQSNGRNHRRLTYTHAIPYEDWMADAHLDLQEDFYGCSGDWQQITIERIINEVKLDRVDYNFTSVPAYIQPDVETEKRRNEQWEAYLKFPVSQTVILPDFRNNQAELTRLREGLETVRSDNNLRVNRIDITGYASPEGSVALNERLSQGRADAMKNYLTSHMGFQRDVYHVTRGGEDWTKLEKLVEGSSLADKNEILAIIRNTADLDTRQSRIASLNGGAPYRQLLSEYYPQLRRVLCVVHYTVRGFSVEEGKEIIKTRPQQLSLDEMFQIANSYPQGSESYNEVFDVAVKMFPEDPVANLNASSIALAKGDYASAKRYLDKADTSTAAYQNNLGIYYLLQEDYGNARNAFTRASQMGSEAGRQNLDQLQKKIESEKIEIR